jgi:hypothetical protein
MLALRELQHAFVKTLLAEPQQALIDRISVNGAANENRLQIYRNNMFISLTAALATIYPAIQKLVGEDFFAGAAHHYIQAYPSAVHNLNDFGDRFAGFLANFSPAKSLPYLSEVARLEWGCHQVFHAADVAVFNLDKLQTIPAEKYDAIKFRLHPASQLFDFTFPVLRIWEMCKMKEDEREATEETVDLSEGGVKLLAIRRALEVEIEKVTAGEFALLSALQAGNEFGNACQLALEVEPNFDVAAALNYHLSRGTLVDFYF